MKVIKAAIFALIAGVLLTLLFGTVIGGLMAVAVFAYFLFKG